MIWPFKKRKDGGPDSNVSGWFFEIKSLFTIAILKFDGETREAYHSHAFDSLSLVLSGELREDVYQGPTHFHPAGRFVLTRRDTIHRVSTKRPTWVLTVRGPWSRFWYEIQGDEEVTLTHGRREVRRRKLPDGEEGMFLGEGLI